MENFLIKLWKLGTFVIFLSLASFLPYFPDPPISACQQGSLQGTTQGSLPFHPQHLLLLPRALPEWATNQAVWLIHLFPAFWGGKLDPSSSREASWSQEPMDLTQPATGIRNRNQLCAPDHCFSLFLPEKNQESVAFLHKSQSSASKVVVSGLGCFLGNGDLRSLLTFCHFWAPTLKRQAQNIPKIMEYPQRSGENVQRMAKGGKSVSHSSLKNKNHTCFVMANIYN